MFFLSSSSRSCPSAVDAVVIKVKMSCTATKNFWTMCRCALFLFEHAALAHLRQGWQWRRSLCHLYLYLHKSAIASKESNKGQTDASSHTHLFSILSYSRLNTSELCWIDRQQFQQQQQQQQSLDAALLWPGEDGVLVTKLRNTLWKSSNRLSLKILFFLLLKLLCLKVCLKILESLLQSGPPSASVIRTCHSCPSYFDFDLLQGFAGHKVPCWSRFDAFSMHADGHLLVDLLIGFDWHLYRLNTVRIFKTRDEDASLTAKYPNSIASGHCSVCVWQRSLVITKDIVTVVTVVTDRRLSLCSGLGSGPQHTDFCQPHLARWREFVRFFWPYLALHANRSKHIPLSW